MYTVQHLLDKKGSSVATIHADATVLDAAKLMNEQRIGALVVTRHDKVIGILRSVTYSIGLWPRRVPLPRRSLKMS